jgi:hypothetical protein
MARLFYRRYGRCTWDPTEVVAPFKEMSLREWEVAVILCSQHQEIEEALRDWLEAPTDHRRWPDPDRMVFQRPLFTSEQAGQSLASLLTQLHDEIKAIRQTLDFPIEAFCGITRNVLLAMHGQRLRWLVRLLGIKQALAEIKRLL